MSEQEARSTTEVPWYARTPHGLACHNWSSGEGGRPPDFCIIGAAKCGTTALADSLGTHPDLFICPVKEPHFFSVDAVFAKGSDWYHGLFASAGRGQKCGEASTSYTDYPHIADAAGRLYAANPEMRLIYVMREPIARVESMALQNAKYLRNVFGIDLLDRPLDAILEAFERPESPHAWPVIDGSRYEVQIARYLERFPPEQILFLLYDDLVEAPKETLRRIARHVGVDPSLCPPRLSSKNRTDDFIGRVREERAAGRLRSLPGVGGLRSMLPRSVRDALRRSVAAVGPEAPRRLSAETRSRLAAEYAPTIDAVERILDRRLSNWRSIHDQPAG